MTSTMRSPILVEDPGTTSTLAPRWLAQARHGPARLGLIGLQPKDSLVLEERLDALADLEIGPRQRQPGRDVSRVTGDDRAPFVHRLIILVGVPQAPGQGEAKGHGA